jgi:hypothetical protein
MADANDEAVINFCSITGSTPEQARFYLESAGEGGLALAMDLYMEGAEAPRRLSHTSQCHLLAIRSSTRAVAPAPIRSPT